MSIIFKNLIVLMVLRFFVNGDWVKISNSMDGQARNKSIKSEFLSEILLKNSTPEHIEHDLPSQEWIDYQKERSKISGKSNVLLVTSVQSLKTSARIVVPAMDPNISQAIDKAKLTTQNKAPEGVQKLGNIRAVITKIDLHSGRENVAPMLGKTKSTQQRGPLLVDATPTTKSTVKMSSMQSFLKFIKTLQNNLIRNTSFGIQDKISKLKDLRDTLLISIEDKILQLMKTDVSKRSKRGILEESSLDFPTAETALMTINFLTFAVFLIKLVLQVVNTIKSKHYSFNGFAVNSMDSVKIAKSRERRFIEENLDKTASILEAINTIKF